MSKPDFSGYTVYTVDVFNSMMWILLFIKFQSLRFKVVKRNYFQVGPRRKNTPRYQRSEEKISPTFFSEKFQSLNSKHQGVDYIHDIQRKF